MPPQQLSVGLLLARLRQQEPAPVARLIKLAVVVVVANLTADLKVIIGRDGHVVLIKEGVEVGA
jgi:hypothetical protein